MPSSAQGRPEDPPAPAAGGARWLCERERKVWLSLVRMLAFLPASLDAQLQRDADLTQFEYYVLAHLSETAEGRTRMSDLAALANGSASRLSHVVARLERRGYVERRSRPDDRRVVEACLTPAGRAKIIASAPAHVEHVRKMIFDVLTEKQQDQLGEISETILVQVDPDPDGCPDHPFPDR